MRTEEEIRAVLRDHDGRMRNTLADHTALVTLAKELGWSPERVRGYSEGATFAYRWVLGEE